MSGRCWAIRADQGATSSRGYAMGMPCYLGREELAEWCLTLAQRAGWGVETSHVPPSAESGAPDVSESDRWWEWAIRSACARVGLSMSFHPVQRQGDWLCMVGAADRAAHPLAEAVERMLLASGGRAGLIVWRHCRLWRLPSVGSIHRLLGSLRATTAIEEEPVAALEPAPEIEAEEPAYATKWVMRWRRSVFEGFVGPAASDLSRSTLCYFALYRPRRRVGPLRQTPRGAVLQELIEPALRSVGAEAVDYRDRSH